MRSYICAYKGITSIIFPEILCKNEKKIKKIYAIASEMLCSMEQHDVQLMVINFQHFHDFLKIPKNKNLRAKLIFLYPIVQQAENMQISILIIFNLYQIHSEFFQLAKLQ